MQRHIYIHYVSEEKEKAIEWKEKEGERMKGIEDWYRYTRAVVIHDNEYGIGGWH
jgi:hypothetical protein